MIKEFFKIRSLLITLLLLISFNSTLLAKDINIETILSDNESVEDSSESIDVFTSDTPEIFVLWKSNELKGAKKMKAVWIADDTNNAAPPNYKIKDFTLDIGEGLVSKTVMSSPGSYLSGTFSLTKPTAGWPLGNYHVEIYVDNELVKSIKFSIE